MKILAWNVRGATKASFRRNFMDLYSTHCPHIAIVSETRIVGTRAETISTALEFDSVHRMDPMGFTSGIWLLWNSAKISMDIFPSMDKVIHAIAKGASTAAGVLPV